jgi:hypothetical protein
MLPSDMKNVPDDVTNEAGVTSQPRLRFLFPCLLSSKLCLSVHFTLSCRDT